MEFLGGIQVPIPVWTVGGALLTGGIIYRIQPDAAGEGMPSYLQEVRNIRSHLPFPVTFSKYFSSLVTIATFGNGGVVGPLGCFCAGVVSSLVGRLREIRFSVDDRRTAAICGMAAAIGTIFHCPIGGGLFAVEIIQRTKLGYRDLFPAILSSIVAVTICTALSLEPFYPITTIREPFRLSLIGWIAILSVLLGVAGGLYTRLYALVVRIFRRDKGNILIKVVIGSLFASTIAFSVNRELFGTSKELYRAIFSFDIPVLTGVFSSTKIPISLVLLGMLVLKAVCNCVTVGSGMSAGFTGPAVLTGMLLGASFASILGISHLSPDYYAFIATGFSGILASSMNVPIAAAVMTVEVFGLSYGLPAGLASIVGFQITSHQTIYNYTLAGSGHQVTKAP